MSTYVQPSSVLSNIPDNACCKNLTISNSDFNNQDLVFWKDNGYNGGTVLAWQSIKSTVPPFIANEEFILPSISKNNDTGIVQATLMTNSPLSNGGQYLTVGPIGSSANYNTIQAAINYAHLTLLASSLLPVIIDVFPGTYNENLVLYNGIILNGNCQQSMFSSTLTNGIFITGTINITQDSFINQIYVGIINVNLTHNILDDTIISTSFLIGNGAAVNIFMNNCRIVTSNSYIFGIINNDVLSNGRMVINEFSCFHQCRSNRKYYFDSTVLGSSCRLIHNANELSESITLSGYNIIDNGWLDINLFRSSLGSLLLTLNNGRLNCYVFQSYLNWSTFNPWLNGTTSAQVTYRLINVDFVNYPSGTNNIVVDMTNLTSLSNIVNIVANVNSSSLITMNSISTTIGQIVNIDLKNNYPQLNSKLSISNQVKTLSLDFMRSLKTFDATPYIIYTYTPPADSNVLIKMNVIGNAIDYSDSTNGDGSAGFNCIAGVITAIVLPIYNIFNTTTGDYTITTDGTVINITVTGTLLEYNWSCKMNIFVNY